MTTARNGNVKTTTDSEEIECVQEFTFLGLQIDQRSKCSLKAQNHIGSHNNYEHESSMGKQGHQPDN